MNSVIPDYAEALRPAYAEMIRILSLDKSYRGYQQNAQWAIDTVKDAERAVELHRQNEYKKYLKKSFSNLTLKGNSKTPPLTFCFVTINPQPDIELDDFIDKIKKCTRSLLFADYLAVLEQRGSEKENTLGKGFHAHILFRRHFPLAEGKPPTQIRRDLKQSFKKYCNTNNPQLLNIQFIGSEFAVDKKLYILGIKNDDEKIEKTHGDKKWRALHNIPDTLGNLNII